ncbi:MAG: 30S ribosomal protein S7 [Nitrososphaeria archaeon]|nr:30S ribosomal protein S7 [Nitrososphaeria archaeon]
MSSKQEYQHLLLFGKWSFKDVKVNDIGLKSVIDLKPVLLPHSFGRHEHQKFAKSKVNIVERLANDLMHFGKKYAKNTGRMGGKKYHALKMVRSAFEIIQLKTGMNPIQVLVRALENAAPNEDTTRIMYGGVVYHVAVDISPQRRLDLALRFISEGVREATFNKMISVEEALAEELILAANNDQNSYAIKKKNEQERIALSSR